MMRFPHSRPNLLVFVVLVAFCPWLLSETPLSPQQVKDLTAMYSQYVQAQPGMVTAVPGLGAAFCNGDGPTQVLVMGYANAADQSVELARLDVPGAAQFVVLAPAQKVTRETLFEIGSVTKTFTAALILRFKDRHALTLDQSLDEWLPQVRYLKGANCEDGDCPSLRQVLSMRSGIPDNDDRYCAPPALCEDDLSPYLESITAKNNQAWQPWLTDAYLGSVSPVAPPGTTYLYSNINYYLLGEIVAELNNYYNIADAYGQMNASISIGHTFLGGFQPVSDKLRSMGYTSKGNTRPNSKSFMTRYWSAGALLSTPEDVATWIYDLMQPGKVLLPDSLEEMKTTIPLNEPEPLDPSVPCLLVTGYGLGMMSLEVTTDQNQKVLLYGHPGRTGGFLSLAAYLPEQNLGFSLLINRRDSAKFSEMICKTVSILVAHGAE